MEVEDSECEQNSEENERMEQDNKSSRNHTEIKVSNRTHVSGVLPAKEEFEDLWAALLYMECLAMKAA